MFYNVTFCTNVHMVQFVWSCILTICKDLGENTLHPQKIIVTKQKIYIWVFLVHVDITSWIIFAHFKYIALALYLN
jgi:hypothetical protein